MNLTEEGEEKRKIGVCKTEGKSTILWLVMLCPAGQYI